ncbi:hypothetical protein ACWFRB_20345 [Rhodococcus sp. NPDC055112]
MKLAITWMFGSLAAAAVLFGGYGDDRAGTNAAAQDPVPCQVQPENASSPFGDGDMDRDDDTWRDQERERMERGGDLQDRRDQVAPDACEPPGIFQSAA